MRKLHLDLQKVGPKLENRPHKSEFKKWLDTTFAILDANESKVPNKELLALPSIEICLRLVDSVESTKLNSQFRGENKQTNVLCFPYSYSEEIDSDLIGDIVMCEDVVLKEAGERHVPFKDQWAWIFIHGILHLFGFDHKEDADTESMQLLESAVLTELKYSDPYS